MLNHVPSVCWQRCTSDMYSQSGQLQGKLTERVAFRTTSCSQAVRNMSHANIGLVGFSVKKSIMSSDLQSTTCFVSLGRQLQRRQSMRGHILNVKFDMPSHQKFSSSSWNLGSMPRKIRGTTSGLGFALPGMANNEGSVDNNIYSIRPTESSTDSAHGKKVYTDYSVTGIPGDGRCLFRSVAHGASIRSGKPIPNEDLQRRFVEGDFDMYVSQVRKPHVWGGEPELFMASHVLQMPITVYMDDKEAGGLIAIAEYGQEYGTNDPIQVLYHGHGHYDALQIPGKSGLRSKL